MPPVSGSARGLHGSAIVTGSGATSWCAGRVDGHGERAPRRPTPAPRAAAARRRRARARAPASSAERAGDEERLVERVADRGDERVVGALGERVVRRALGAGEVSRWLVDRVAAGRRAGSRCRRPSAARARAAACPAAAASRRGRARRRARGRCAWSRVELVADERRERGERRRRCPAWRTVSSRAASPAVRSGSSSPPSAGSARPIPAPASSCGGKVQATVRVGQEGQAQRPGADEQRSRRRRGRRAGRGCASAASAASGRTVTAAAAAQRLDAPAGDELEDEQEEHGGQRRPRRAPARPRAPAGERARAGAGGASSSARRARRRDGGGERRPAPGR